MGNAALDLTNISILEPLPVSKLKAEMAQFEQYPPKLSTGQAARLMGVTSVGAGKLHDRSDLICDGRDELGNRIYKRDGCIAYRWAQLNFYATGETEQGGWE